MLTTASLWAAGADSCDDTEANDFTENNSETRPMLPSELSPAALLFSDDQVNWVLPDSPFTTARFFRGRPRFLLSSPVSAAEAMLFGRVLSDFTDNCPTTTAERFSAL